MLTAGYGSTAGYQFDYALPTCPTPYDIGNPYLNGMGTYRTGVDYSKGLVTFYNMNVCNPALKWKTTRNVNVGVSGRISTVDIAVKYYNSLSKNLLTLEEQNIAFGSATAMPTAARSWQFGHGILGGGRRPARPQRPRPDALRQRRRQPEPDHRTARLFGRSVQRVQLRENGNHYGMSEGDPPTASTPCARQTTRRPDANSSTCATDRCRS